nr:macrophage mannose receptor 1-like [Lytechinus pictus]
MSAGSEVTYRCNGGWWKFGNRCYRILGNTWVSRPDAIDICNRANSQLFVPSNQDEYDAVTEYINNIGQVSTDDNPTPRDIEDVWVGCDDEEVEGTYQCLDGTSLTSSSGWFKSGYDSPDTYFNCVAYFEPEGLEYLTCEVDGYSKVLCEGIMSTGSEVTYRCNGGWWKFGNRCYRILGNTWVSKPDAIDICTRANSQLFVPSNQTEYDAVTEYINNLGPVSTDDNPTPRDIYAVWVGCDDEDVEGTYQCADGTSFTSSSGRYDN